MQMVGLQQECSKQSHTFFKELQENRLKDKLIKKVCPHAPADLATAIRHAKSYEMAMEEANHTKLTNSQRRLKAILQTNNNSSNNHKDINHHNDATKTILDYSPTTNLKIVIIVEFQDTGNEIAENCKETNKTEVINIILYHNNFTTNLYHQLIIYQDHKIKTNNNNRINSNNQLVLRNSGQQKPNHYYTQSSYLTIPEKSDFQQLALFEGEVAASRSNPSNNTILPVQIAQNANLSDIFPFEFKANKSPFLLSNTTANKQKAITVMYTETTVEGKPIRLILDSGSAGSIITYQLIQQLQRTVNRPAQTVIVTADSMKKTPVGEIDNFLFTIDEITIPVKVLVMDAPQYQALELKISYQKQYTIVSATCGTFNKQLEKAPVFEFEEEKEIPLTETYTALGLTFNWAEKTEQEIFKESREWKKVRYSIPEPQKQPPYIPLKCKDYNKKLSSMGACISPEEEYETHICYFCKACHRERFGFPKRNGKWDKTSCLTCGDMLPEECN
ncbi:hypothetical protein G9A89_019432 [Geosiphon pyriformis]|nr:hypothetical protein G9A89_019432 [Geosiphon pyriformis]